MCKEQGKEPHIKWGGGTPLLHLSSLDYPEGLWLGGEPGVPRWGCRDPVSPGTKRNALSTWFPLAPAISFFTFWGFFTIITVPPPLFPLQRCWAGGGAAPAPAGRV